MLLMVFGGSLGLILDALGGSFGAFAGFRWHHEFSKLLFGLPSWPNLLFFFVSAFAPFFEVIVFLILEPLGVDFELSSWPSDPQKP